MRTVNKVIIIISNISIGGAQRIALTLVKWMMKEGIEAKLIAIGSSNGNYEIPDDINVNFMNHSSNLKALITIKKMRSYLKSEKPDVIITMGVASCLFTVPASIGLKRIKHIISERNDPRHFLGKRYVKCISRLFMKYGDGFVFQTDDARDYYSKSLKNRGVVIPNPLLVDNLPNAIQSEKKRKIVTMGRLTKQKNHRLLIDAFDEFWKNHQNYELHIYGSGELEQETRAYIRNKKSNKAILLFQACNDVLNRIKDAEIFVLSSDFEGMPNALIEAMSMGIASISTDCPCGGPRYLIENGKNGFLVPTDNVSKLAEKMSLLADDTSLREKIACESSMLKERLSTEKISKQWLDYCIKTVN